MRILGISCYFHDASAAIIEDGRLIAAAEEERFTRIKHDFNFPSKSIDFCIEAAGIEKSEIDHVVLFEKPFRKFERLLKTSIWGFPKTHRLFEQSMRTWLFEKLWVKSQIKDHLGIDSSKIMFSEHHVSHAASAYFCSPFDEAAVITYDGVGEWATSTVAIGRGSELKTLKEMRFPHSIGLLYSAFTAFLGFEINEGEYKVMGMAPYGEPKFESHIWKMIEQYDDGSIWLDPSYFSFHNSTKKSFTKKFEKLMGTPRAPETPFFTSMTGYPPYFGEKPSDFSEQQQENQHYADIAASIQKVTEEIILKLVRSVHSETGISKLCLAGGVALNCVANGRILAETPITDLYIQPAAGDGGGALGAALHAWHTALGGKNRVVMEHAYWGESYNEENIVQAITASGLKSFAAESEEAAAQIAAEHIAEGKVIGWFQGKFEWGPRSLGNRSILADPRLEEMKDIVNTKIKFREPFRPFAPSVLEDRAAEYFDLPADTSGLPERFMQLVVPIKSEHQKTIPAVNHNGTARLQTVYRETNHLYYELIQRFGEITGVPIVLNTSFNVRGEPIVNTPEQAINTFQNTGIDTLFIGRHILEKAVDV
jgi:carbamoyltransferase